MRRLMLLRHAKSDLSLPGQADHERDLNQRGRDTGPKVGHYVARHALRPDRVLCSTARRARATWDLVAAEIGESPPVTYERRLYNAPAASILDVVQGIDDAVHILMVIGHNPGLQDLAGMMIASGDLDHRERLHEKLPTAALVVIDFAVDSWAELHPHAGRLERFIVPRSLETTTE
jgi:phosphohistidine phosphatase